MESRSQESGAESVKIGLLFQARSLDDRVIICTRFEVIKLRLINRSIKKKLEFKMNQVKNTRFELIKLRLINRSIKKIRI